MSYTHLTKKERIGIEIFIKLGHKNSQIAKFLGRNRETIRRERKRINNMEEYCSDSAQLLYKQARKASRPYGKCNKQLVTRIEGKLEERWSPEQIANTLAKGEVCTKTIYNWMYGAKLPHVDIRALRQRGKRRRPKDARGSFALGTPIAERSAHVEKREEFGHWELDTVVSGRGQSKSCLATFVERKSRFYTALLIPDRTATSMLDAINYLCSCLPFKAIKTATADRGKEFACHKIVESELRFPIFFADPYSSWQRGSNENANGLLRDFFPKRTDFGKVTQEEVRYALELINSRPRKCLGWKSAQEVFFDELSRLDSNPLEVSIIEEK